MILKNASILVVDDDQDVLTAVRLLLKTEVKEVITEKNPENLRWHLNKDHFDLILLDMNFTSSIHTGNEGLFWLNEIKKLKTDSAVIMITAYGDIDLAVRSLKEGAADFVVKPWHNEKLISIIKDSLERKESKTSLAPGLQSGSIIGKELIGESEAPKSTVCSLICLMPPPDPIDW